MPRRNRIRAKVQQPKVQEATISPSSITIDMAQRDRILHADRIWTGVGK